ncbi:hypothetical protein BK411_02710 [Vibrio splendidus]|nr:hypothetical protein BK411_02710 [Vibrio splendidus]
MATDHFKNINDTCGHTCGDKILEQFTNLIQDDGPSEQASFRWGWEEFLMLVPLEKDSNLDEIAYSLITSIRNKLWEEEIPVTCSIGFSTFVDSIEHIIHFADRALYCAKNSGRN